MGIILHSITDAWREGRGDFNALGWATTAAYLLAAVCCARAAAAARRSPADAPEGDRPGPWWLLAAGLLMLGLNKQLDLQIFVRELAIALIALLGMNEHRRWFGRAFVLVMGIFLLKVMATAVRRMRGHTRGHRLLLTGLALLACFAVVRAGTYVPGLKQVNLHYGRALHLVFEFSGIMLVGVSALRTRQRLVRHHSSSISNA